LIDGTLINSGKFYFPGQNGHHSERDPSAAPIIETKDGGKILILPEKDFDKQLLENVNSFWKNLRIQRISEIIKEA
jgi:hypothetical protein